MQQGCSEDSEYTSAQTLPAPGTPVLATLPHGLSDCIGGAAREPVLPYLIELLRGGTTSNQACTPQHGAQRVTSVCSLTTPQHPAEGLVGSQPTQLPAGP